ncbi:DUF3800 domain-containing protein [bacterium]|nr:DUF3800 domain-containing protein [bacterium]
MSASAFSRPIFRLYIDEVGHANYSCNLQHPQNKYFSLTGVVTRLDYVQSTIAPDIESLKQNFFNPPHHPDNPVILHRKEIKGKLYPFKSLLDPGICTAFDSQLLALLAKWEFKVYTVTVNKEALFKAYSKPFDPYHYALHVMIERFVYFLNQNRSIGDVMVESRNGPLDRILRQEYARVWQKGTRFEKPGSIQAALTSRELKTKSKTNNIPGLQIADILASPCFALHAHQMDGTPPPSRFGSLVAQIVASSKYDMSITGQIDGFGRKWLS